MKNSALLLAFTMGFASLSHAMGEMGPYSPMAIGDSGAVPEGARSIDEILAGDHRPDKNKARDGFRHPAETLAFFGLAPDMTVLEIWPGGGWYMEVVAPYVAGKGQYYAAGYDREGDSPYVRRATEAMVAKVTENPEVYGRIILTELGKKKLVLAPEGEVDMVLTFRNVHNWMDGSDHPDKVFAAMFHVLRPGGILGVVEHRASADNDQDPTAANGYVREDHVIALAEKAGFQLVDRAEINANPADPKDHASGVWTLPPSFRLGDKDREKYEAIGESDRMTLKFTKPRTTGYAEKADQ